MIKQNLFGSLCCEGRCTPASGFSGREWRRRAGPRGISRCGHAGVAVVTARGGDVDHHRVVRSTHTELAKLSRETLDVVTGHPMPGVRCGQVGRSCAGQRLKEPQALSRPPQRHSRHASKGVCQLRTTKEQLMSLEPEDLAVMRFALLMHVC